MDRRALTTNFLVAIAVQGFAFVVSAMTAFVVPKVLGVEPFGYWQLFLFYVGFLGFSQLGISDGVYLRYGGTRRLDLDRRGVSQQFSIVMAVQVSLAVVLAVSGSVVVGGERGFVLVSLAVMVPAFTTIRYLGFVFQAMNETKLFSLAVLIQNAAFFVPLAVLIALRVEDERPYIISYVAAQLPALLYCMFHARGLLTLQSVRLVPAVRESIVSMSVGFKLLIATLSDTLILGAARLVIDAKWDIATFGSISLAITLVTFFLTLMAQASLVLFPALRQANPNDQRNAMLRIRGIASLLLPASYVLYFPIVWCLSAWLPKYSGSFALASLVMPICTYDGMMQIVYSTYFKVARKERLLMVLNLGAVGLSVAGVLFFGLACRSLDLVLLTPVVASVLRGVVADRIFVRELGGAHAHGVALATVLGLIFVLCARFLELPVAFAIVFAAYASFVVSRRSDIRWLAASFGRL